MRKKIENGREEDKYRQIDICKSRVTWARFVFQNSQLSLCSGENAAKKQYVMRHEFKIHFGSITLRPFTCTQLLIEANQAIINRSPKKRR